MLTQLDAGGVEQFVDQTDLNGSAAGGTVNPMPAGVTYTSMQAAMQAILDFANNDLTAIQTTMAGYATDFAAINIAWNDLLTVQWPDQKEVMDAEVDTWLARLSGSLSADGRVLIKKTPGNQLNWMYVLPKATYEQVRPDLALGTGTLEAFIHNAGEYDQIAIDMFPAALVNGELVSQPGQVPYVSKNRAEFKALFEAQQFDVGHRHLETVYERAARLHETYKLGHNVIGNTAYGVSHEDTSVVGVCPAGTYTLTGSMGPRSSHNGLSAGIYDTCGNVWNWVDGFELSDSEAMMIANNDPSGTPVTTGEFMNVATHLNSQALKRACIVSAGNPAEKGGFWVNHAGVRGLLSGGYWGSGSSAGPSAAHLSNSPAFRYSNIGGRSAFVF